MPRRWVSTIVGVGASLILVLCLLGWFAFQPIIVPGVGLVAEKSGPVQEQVTPNFFPLVPKGPNCIYCYYVDSVNGSDANAGTTVNKPWRTLAPVEATNLLPGSIVQLRRGSRWTGGLFIDDSGLDGQPILFTAYGQGPRPVITNPGSATNWTRGVEIDADWIIVQELLIEDVHEAGVYLHTGANHNVIQNIEVTEAGTGVTVGGKHNLVSKNYIHDLHMVRDTPGGNDDFGAVGVKLYDSYNLVTFNRMENCIAPSMDYGVDGGGVEIYGRMKYNNIHHNWVANSAGFLEVGGGSAEHIVVAYNVSVNNGRFSFLHLIGHYASIVKDFRVENNTIVEIADDEDGWVLLGFKGAPTAETFWARNNIFYADGFKFIANESGFTHHHNLYHLDGGTELGFTLGQAEQVADPQFASLPDEDFDLLPGSPAIDAGIDLGYALDFEGRPVPVGSAPDQGAFEYDD